MSDLTAGAIQEIASLADGANGAEALNLGSYYIVTSRDGALHKVDLTGDQYRDTPKRKQGTTTVRDVPSLVEHWKKHYDGDSELYADRERLTVTAVLDAHGPVDGMPNWQQHRIILALKHSEAWKAWTNADGRAMDQEAFAEFLEDNRQDIHTPPAAEMLEIAQSLQATTKAEFASAVSLSTGQRKFAWVESAEAKAGQRGDLTIPTEITLAVPVFDGALVADAVTARFRYRIVGGKLTLLYKLDRPADVITSAFNGVIAEVTEGCSTPVLRGTPIGA